MSSDKVDKQKYECLNNYKKKIAESVPFVEQIYEGYLKNYSEKGPLIDKNYFIN